MSKKTLFLVLLVIVHIAAGYLISQTLMSTISSILEKDGFRLINFDVGGGINLILKVALLFGTIPLINHVFNKLLKVENEKTYWINYSIIIGMILFSFIVMYLKFELVTSTFAINQVEINSIPILEHLLIGILAGITIITIKKFIPFKPNNHK